MTKDLRRAFIVVSVTERIDDLLNLIRSINDQGFVRAGYDIHVYVQGANADSVAQKLSPIVTAVHYNFKRLGCHAARVELLRLTRGYDLYVNLDDDMELTAETNYTRAEEQALIPTTGFVITNWARTAELLAQKVPKMQQKMVPQVLVYQGGGMAYRDEIANLMRDLPTVHQTFDTIWPLTAYLNGFRNYRDLSSLAIHRACTTGGMNRYMAETPAATSLEQFVKFRRAKRQNGTGKDLLIPLDSDLLPEAHLAHKAARDLRFKAP